MLPQRTLYTIPQVSIFPTLSSGYPFPTLSFRAQREIFFAPLPSSFAKPSRGSTALPRYGVSHFSFSNILHLTANEKDPSASLGMTIRETCFLTHSLCDARDIILHAVIGISHSPRCHFERSEKSFSSPFSMTPSLSRLGEAPPSPFSEKRCFPFLFLRHSPSCRQRKRSLDFARDDDTEKTHFPHTLCMIQRISIPYTVISSAARNLPCTPSFLAPFAKGFPFSAIPHTALYRCARKIPPLRSG